MRFTKYVSVNRKDLSKITDSDYMSLQLLLLPVRNLPVVIYVLSSLLMNPLGYS